MTIDHLDWKFDDGGRPADVDPAVGDCVIRSAAIVLGKTYESVRESMMACGVPMPCDTRPGISRFGIIRKWYHQQKRFIRVSLKDMPEFPRDGTYLVSVSTPDGSFFGTDKHCTAIIDGVIHDAKDQRILNRKVHEIYRVVPAHPCAATDPSPIDGR